MTQTAVEWLESQIIKFHNWKRNPIYDENCFDEIELAKAIQKAKEIEKQQNIEFAEWCLSELLNGSEPKEEPKQEHSKYLSCCKSLEKCHCDKKPKQETLEEAIDRISKEDGYDIEGGKVADFVDGMVKGAKWQQERMYSEEKIDKILQKLEEIKIMINIR